MQTKGKTIALLYLRVSSKRQEVEGTGLESQEHRCRELCVREGFEVRKVFRDSFSGGGDFIQRPAMRDLLNYIDTNPHNEYVIVFDDLKRFARDVEFHLKLKTAFRSRNVSLKCLNYEFDDTPEGKFVELIFAGQAELERQQNKRQVVQKMKACIEAGRWPFGGKKIGYARTIDPVTRHKLLTFDRNAEFVKEALEGFAYKRFIRKIDVARFLKEKKVFGEAIPERYLDTVSAMLVDVFYAGFVEFPKWEVSRRKGEHKALISYEVFDLNQKRLEGERKGKRVRHSPNPDFYLGGLVECPECSHSLRYYWSQGRTKKYAYYECKTRGCSLSGKTVSKDLLEGSFNKILERHKPKEGLVEVATEMFSDVWNEELKGAKQEDRELIAEKTNLEEEFQLLAKKVSKAPENSALEKQLSKLLEEQAQKLEDFEEKITPEIDYGVSYRTALERVLGTLKKPLEMWLSANIFQKQKLFFFFFDQKLAFAVGAGYRTAQLSPVLRLFEQLDTPNSDDVEMGGFEPPSENGRSNESTMRRSL